MKNKPILIEIVWLLGCIAITIIIGLLFFGKAIFEKDIDINLHDTYLIIKNQHFFICFFTFLSFSFYFIKEKRNSFNRKLAFFIFLTLGLSLNILIVKAGPIVAFFNPWQSGWTVYPPLSVKAKPIEVSAIKGFASTFLTPFNALFAIQFLVIALMLFAAYKHGKSRVINFID